MKRKACFRLLLLLVLSLTALSCSVATTKFQSTWKSPDAVPLQLQGRKIVTVFISRDPLLRRHAEDAMAREITARGADAVPAYTFLSDDDVRDRDTARAKAESRGFAAAVVMRVVGSETRYYRHVSPGVWVTPPYRHFWGAYWGWGWGTVWEPSYLSVDRIVKVETLVYSLERDELVWAAVSRTIDPGRLEAFVGELAFVVSRRMAREGLLARTV